MAKQEPTSLLSSTVPCLLVTPHAAMVVAAVQKMLPCD